MSIIQSNISIADKYPAYKDSGEYWLGDIPEGWEIKKLKHVFHEKKKVTNPALNCGSISFGKVVYKDDKKIPESTKASYQEVLAGEYLVNPLNLNYDLISLRIGLSDINVVVSSGYIVLKNTIELDKSYFNYLLHRYDVAYMKLLGSGVRQTISFNHIANSLLAYPPKEEQTAIATFLDDKTTKIDRVIAQKQQMIALLKERKQIIIQDLVTGKKVWNEKQNAWVDSRSSSEVEMKDSGVEWIGEIPEHWEVEKLKHIFFEKKKTFNPNLNCGSISYGEVVYKDDEKIPESTKASYQELLCGEFLINPLNLNYDLVSLRIGLSEIDVVVSPGYLILKPHKIIEKKYFKYLLHRYDVAYMKLLGAGVRQTISFNHISNSLLVIPTISEQNAIVAHIETQSTKIDQAIQLQERQIDKLKELKATLIDGGVTGKIRVPSVQEIKVTKV